VPGFQVLAVFRSCRACARAPAHRESFDCLSHLDKGVFSRTTAENCSTRFAEGLSGPSNRSDASSTRPLTVPEVAKFLRVRRSKVLAWIRSGRLRGYNVAERENGKPTYRVNPDDLAAFTKLRMSNQTAPTGRPPGSRSVPKREVTWTQPDIAKREPR
jgi:excisionase family DNA binding protein